MRILQFAVAGIGMPSALFQDTRTIPLRFAPANVAAMKTLDLPGFDSLRKPIADESVGTAMFGLLLRSQIPSEAGKAAAGEIKGHPATVPSAGQSLAPPVASQKQSGEYLKTFEITGKELNLAKTEFRHTQAALTQVASSVQQPSDTLTDLAGDTVSPAEGERATIAEVPKPLWTSGVEEANVAVPEVAGSMNARPEVPCAIILHAPSAAIPLAEHSAPAGVEDQPKSVERFPMSRDRKSEPGGRSHALKTDAALPTLDSGTLPAAAVSAPIVAHGSPSAGPVVSPGLSPAWASDGKTQMPTEESSLRASRSHTPSPLQPAPPNSDQESAAGTVPIGSREGVDDARPAAASRCSAINNTQGRIFSIEPRASDSRRQAGPAAADGQHARLPVGPATVSTIGPQSVQSPQGAGLGNSTVPASRLAADPPLHTAGAFERMDAASPPRVLESSRQNLAVGIRDAGLGWIEIRTHAIGGHVAASLASGTQEAHAAIAAELPAIRDTLVNQHIALHSLSAERFPTSSGGGGSGTDTSDSGQPARSPLMKPKADTPSAQNEAEGENLSYISVRV